MIAILPPEKSKELAREKLAQWRGGKEKKALEAKATARKAPESRIEAEKVKPEPDGIGMDTGAGMQPASAQEKKIIRFLNAAGKGDIKAVKRALGRGMAIDAMCRDGFTALMRASFKGCIDVVELLIENGARVEDRDGNGRSVLDYAFESRDYELVRILRKHGAPE